MDLKRSANGYTLVEVMIVAAILGIVASVGALSLLKITQAHDLATTIGDIQQGAFTAFDVTSALLRQAQSSSVVIDQYDPSEPPWSRITFSIPNSSMTFTFYQKGQTFYIGNNPMLQHLRSLTFSYPNTNIPDIIGISVTFEENVGSIGSKAIELFIQRIKIQN